MSQTQTHISSWSHPVVIADLTSQTSTDFVLTPKASVMKDLATYLGLAGLRKLRFQGTLTPIGKRDWALQGQLGATVVQPCVLTLDPVTTRIETPVERRYLADLPQEEAGPEIEMSEDDSIEPLQSQIDLGVVMAESLALHIPLYPRADGAKMEQNQFTEPGKDAMTDADSRPFAGLNALRDKLGKDGE